MLVAGSLESGVGFDAAFTGADSGVVGGARVVRRRRVLSSAARGACVARGGGKYSRRVGVEHVRAARLSAGSLPTGFVYSGQSMADCSSLPAACETLCRRLLIISRQAHPEVRAIYLCQTQKEM